MGEDHLNLRQDPPKPTGSNTWYARAKREQQRREAIPLPTKPYKPARTPDDY
jgi:hypothetical protein